MTRKPRVTSVRGLVLIAAFAATIQAVVSAPASLIVAVAGFGDTTIGYETSEGTIWNGAFHGVDASGAEIGTVTFATSPLTLITGQLAVEFSVTGGALQGQGAATLGMQRRLSLTDARFIADLGAVSSRFAFLGQPLEGVLRADIEQLVWDRDGCRESKARLVTDVLAAPARRLNSRAFDLAGGAVCDDGSIVVSLSGGGDEGNATLVVQISPQMTYSLTARAAPSRASVADALQLLGFEEDEGALTTATEGAIRWDGS